MGDGARGAEVGRARGQDQGKNPTLRKLRSGWGTRKSERQKQRVKERILGAWVLEMTCDDGEREGLE